MSAQLKGPWGEQEITYHLQNCGFPIRLACVTADGSPRVVSLWYQYHGGEIFCVSHRDASLVKILARNPLVGFEVSPNEPPYYGVRGHGIATVQPLDDSPALRELLDSYLGGTSSRLAKWLLSRQQEEVLINIEPEQLFSWDYRERMADIA